jgi:hypothetical protein
MFVQFQFENADLNDTRFEEFPQGCAYLLLVPVNESAVNVSITAFNGHFDGLADNTGFGQPGPIPDLGHKLSIVELQKRHGHHSKLGTYIYICV